MCKIRKMMWLLLPRSLRRRKSNKVTEYLLSCWPFTTSTCSVPLRWVPFLPLFYDKERGTVICLGPHCCPVQSHKLSPEPTVSPLHAAGTTSQDVRDLLFECCPCCFTATRSWQKCLTLSEPQFPYLKNMDNGIYSKGYV